MNIRLSCGCFLKIFFLILISTFFTACAASPKKVQINEPIIVNQVEKIPLRVGLYLGEYFKTFKKEHRGERVIYMGESLWKGAEEVADKVFEKVINVQIGDPKSIRFIPERIEALVFPEIDKIWGGYPDEIQKVFAKGVVLVRIKWSIFDGKGKILYMNTFGSEGKYQKMYGTPEGIATRVCEAYTQAIKDNFAKAYVGISSTNWWQSFKKETN
jgi:hypothetical protein